MKVVRCRSLRKVCIAPRQTDFDSITVVVHTGSQTAAVMKRQPSLNHLRPHVISSAGFPALKLWDMAWCRSSRMSQHDTVKSLRGSYPAVTFRPVAVDRE